MGKSTVAVNLAYTLAGMGARVGIFDADVYGPSLPTMVSPENRLLEMVWLWNPTAFRFIWIRDVIITGLFFFGRIQRRKLSFLQNTWE